MTDMTDPKEKARHILIKVHGCKTTGEDCTFQKCNHWGTCKLLEEAFTEAILTAEKQGAERQRETIANKITLIDNK